MKIVIFTIGTQGDARPFVGLGRSLKALGHEVSIATAQRHAKLITNGGISYMPLESDVADIMSDADFTLEKGNQLKIGRQMARWLCRWVPLWISQATAAAKGADLIIGSGSGSTLGASIAEKYGIPFVQAQFMPLTPSRTVSPLWPCLGFSLPGIVNLSLTHITRMIVWHSMSRPIAVLRHELGLSAYGLTGPWSTRNTTEDKHYILYAFSRHLQPQPQDWPTDRIAVTGNWFYNESTNWSPPDELEHFLAAGPAPIYVGFGSMISNEPETFTQVILEALRLTGKRAVVATGWGGLKINDHIGNEKIFVIDNAPHDWLFPRVSIAVHHGGAGTVAAATRAGLPQIIIPFLADQFFWGQRLKKIGISPVTLNRKTLKAKTLANAICRATSQPYTAKARALGARIKTEDGISQAIKTLEKWGLLTENGSDLSSVEIVPHT